MSGFTPDEVLEDWLGWGPALVAITLGGDGVHAGTSTGLRTRRPGVPVTVIDTVGAATRSRPRCWPGCTGAGCSARRPTALHTIAHSTLDALLDEAMLAAAITCSRRGANIDEEIWMVR